MKLMVDSGGNPGGGASPLDYQNILPRRLEVLCLQIHILPRHCMMLFPQKKIYLNLTEGKTSKTKNSDCFRQCIASHLYATVVFLNYYKSATHHNFLTWSFLNIWACVCVYLCIFDYFNILVPRTRDSRATKYRSRSFFLSFFKFEI